MLGSLAAARSCTGFMSTVVAVCACDSEKSIQRREMKTKERGGIRKAEERKLVARDIIVFRKLSEQCLFP